MLWEERLLDEMYRLKNEFEQYHLDERNKEVEQLKRDFEEDTRKLTETFKNREQELQKQVQIVCFTDKM